MSEQADKFEGVIRRPFADGWSIKRLNNEIDDAWRKYEMWRTEESKLTRKQRIEKLNRIEATARRLMDLLNPATGDVWHDLQHHYPTNDERFAFDLSPLVVNAPNSENPDGDMETHTGYQSDRALKYAISGIEGLQRAAADAAREREKPVADESERIGADARERTDPKIFREQPGPSAQQYILGKALPEVFEQAFVEKNGKPCKFGLSHEDLGKSPGGRFISWVWRDRTGEDLTMRIARSARSAKFE